MRSISNPNQRLITIFGVLAVVGLAAGAAGFLLGGEDGFVWGILGLVLGGTFAVILPIVWVMGKKQIAEIQALLAGEGLLAHWTFDPDEWQRHTENEYTRGVTLARKTSLWTFGVTLVLMLVICLISDALNGTGLLVSLGIAGGFTALFGGGLYLAARITLADNRRGVGEVFIGATSVYFGDKFHSWKGNWAALEKVAFEPGDPCVVQFDYRVGSGDQRSHVEVRIPVPRGRETEAQDVVNSYYAES